MTPGNNVWRDFRNKIFPIGDEKSWCLPLDDWFKIDYIIYELKKYEGSIQNKTQ